MSLEAENVTPPQKPQRRRGGGNTAAPANAAVEAQLENLGMPTPSAAPPPAHTAEPDDLMTLDQAAQQPAAAPRERESAPQAAAAAEEPAEDPLNPFRRDPLPPLKETKNQQKENRVSEKDALNKPTQSLKRFGELGKKLGGAEHIQVSKRMDNGELAYVGEYNTRDISQSQNIQAFLNRYVKPGYGPGEYQILGVDAHGREFDGGSVTLLATITGSPETVPSVLGKGPMDILQSVLDRESQRQTSEIRALAQNQKDPIQMLRDMHELHQQFSPPVVMPKLQESNGGNRGGDAMSAMVTGMMGMMGTVLAVVLQPKPQDPLMLAVINKLLDDKRPAPTVDPTAQLLSLSEVIKNLRGDSGGGGGKDDRLVDVLLKERMSPAEVLGLVQQVKGERGTDDLKKSMENVGMLLNAVQQLRAQTEPGTSSGFWEAVTTALGNPSLASVIGSRVRGVVNGGGAPAPQQLPPPQQVRALPPGQTNDPLVLKARELAARKMRLEEAEISRREEALGIKPVITPPPAQVATPAADVVPTVSPLVAPLVAPELPTEVVADVPPVDQVTLPPNVADHVNSYLQAKDDGDFIETTVEMIFDMANDEKWKPYSEVIVALILQSDRARFLQYMASMFVSLRTIGLITDELGGKIMDALQRNFDVVVSVVREHVESPQEGAETEGEEGNEDEDGEGNNDGEEPEDLLKLD